MLFVESFFLFFIIDFLFSSLCTSFVLAMEDRLGDLLLSMMRVRILIGRLALRAHRLILISV